MANDINKILVIPQWQVVGTVSNPDIGYVKIYPQGLQWWVTDENGYNKKIAIDYFFNNGFLLTSLSTSSFYNKQIDLNIGSGLSFSSSKVFVNGLTASNLSTINSFSNGYILSVTASGDFNWIPYSNTIISGTTNSIPKFNSISSIGNSMIYDDGNTIHAGYYSSLNSLISATLSVYGNLHVNNKINFANQVYRYLTDNMILTNQLNWSLFYNNGSNPTYSWLSFGVDVGYTSFTFSLLNSFIQGSVIGGTKSFTIPNIDYLTIGTSSSISNVYINSLTPSIWIKDGNQGSNKFFVSDSNGLATWKNIYGYNGVTTSGIGIGVNAGYGITYSNGNLIWDRTIVGYGLTVSVNGTVSLLSSGATPGVYGSTLSIPVVNVDQYGRIVGISTTQSYIPPILVLSPNDKNWISIPVSNSIGTASTYSISGNPYPGSYISVYINGEEVSVGNATTSAACYFGPSSDIVRGFSYSNYPINGDYLYWNPIYAGYDLESGWRISLSYLK